MFILSNSSFLFHDFFAFKLLERTEIFEMYWWQDICEHSDVLSGIGLILVCRAHWNGSLAWHHLVSIPLFYAGPYFWRENFSFHQKKRYFEFALPSVSFHLGKGLQPHWLKKDQDLTVFPLSVYFSDSKLGLKLLVMFWLSLCYSVLQSYRFSPFEDTFCVIAGCLSVLWERCTQSSWLLGFPCTITSSRSLPFLPTFSSFCQTGNGCSHSQSWE